jgi:Zn-dependent protease
MAAAGPLANLLLALVAVAALQAGVLGGVWDVAYVPDASNSRIEIEYDRLVAPITENDASLEGVGRLLSILLTLNAVLFVFNLIPLPPMDGAAVVSGLFPVARRWRGEIRANPWMSLAGLVFAWWIFGSLFRPLFLPVLRWLGFPV